MMLAVGRGEGDGVGAVVDQGGGRVYDRNETMIDMGGNGSSIARGVRDGGTLYSIRLSGVTSSC